MKDQVLNTKCCELAETFYEKSSFRYKTLRKPYTFDWVSDSLCRFSDSWGDVLYARVGPNGFKIVASAPRSPILLIDFRIVYVGFRIVGEE